MDGKLRTASESFAHVLSERVSQQSASICRLVSSARPDETVLICRTAVILDNVGGLSSGDPWVVNSGHRSRGKKFSDISAGTSDERAIITISVT